MLLLSISGYFVLFCGESDFQIFHQVRANGRTVQADIVQTICADVADCVVIRRNDANGQLGAGCLLHKNVPPYWVKYCSCLNGAAVITPNRFTCHCDICDVQSFPPPAAEGLAPKFDSYT